MEKELDNVINGIEKDLSNPKAPIVVDDPKRKTISVQYDFGLGLIKKVKLIAKREKWTEIYNEWDFDHVSFDDIEPYLSRPAKDKKTALKKYAQKEPELFSSDVLSCIEAAALSQRIVKPRKPSPYGLDCGGHMESIDRHKAALLIKTVAVMKKRSQYSLALKCRVTGSRVKQMTRKDEHYLRDIVECALNTGMRKGEILGLKWEQVRNGFIYLRKTKTNDPRQIPINDDLDALFKRIRQRQGLRSAYVFIFQGKPMDGLNNGFKAALKRAGIEDFRFHDLRHTFASHFVMRGGDLKALQEILGHKTLTMTMRYAHLSPGHKIQAISLLNGLTTNCHAPVTFAGNEKSSTL